MRRKEQIMRVATRRRKQRIWITYWRPGRSRSGHPPLPLMQALMMRVGTTQSRTRRLLQVQSSSRHRVLVLSHPVVSLPPRFGEAQWREACLLSWPRWQDQSTGKSGLTQMFFLFLQS